MKNTEDEMISFGHDLDNGRGTKIQPGGMPADPHPKPGSGGGHGRGHEHSNGNHQGHHRPTPIARSHAVL